MSYSKKFNKREVVYSHETVDEILALPCKAIDDRGITQATAEHFGIRCLFSEVSGKPQAYYFPVKKKGKVVGFHKRDLRYPKKSDDHFKAVGDVDLDCELFGQDLCKQGKVVIICEGQFDAAFAWQTLMMYQQVPGQYVPNVVSIGFGTANASTHIANNLDFIEQYQEVRIAFDSDEATPAQAKKGIVKGKEAASDACLVLGNRAKVITFDRKDPCEYSDAPKELYKFLAFGAKEYAPDVLIRGGVGLDNLLKPIPTGVTIRTLPETTRILHGLRPGEMTTILAPSNVGKSTICREIQYDLIDQGKFVANYFIEEDAVKTQQAMIAMDNHVLLPKFREDTSIIPYDKAEISYRKMIENDRTLWVDTAKTFGKLTPKDFIKSLKWAHAMGAEFAILDHISMVFSASENDNERKEIDNLLTELAAFVTATKMHLIVVSHIKRVPKQVAKEKDGSIKYPYWHTVDKDAGRGSGAFEQLTHNMIVIEPEMLESGERGRIRTRVVKNREWPNLGIGDIVTMHPTTGRLVDAKDRF